MILLVTIVHSEYLLPGRQRDIRRALLALVDMSWVLLVSIIRISVVRVMRIAVLRQGDVFLETEPVFRGSR